MGIYNQTIGEVCYQCGHQLNSENMGALNVFREMGAVIHFINNLQQPKTYVNESRCIIPSQYVAHNHLLDLLAHNQKTNLSQTEIFSPLINDLKYKLDETYSKLATKENKLFLYGLILNRLTEKTCNEILKDGCNLLDKNISLTPLRKLWVAWQTRYFS